MQRGGGNEVPLVAERASDRFRRGSQLSLRVWSLACCLCSHRRSIHSRVLTEHGIFEKLIKKKRRLHKVGWIEVDLRGAGREGRMKSKHSKIPNELTITNAKEGKIKKRLI